MARNTVVTITDDIDGSSNATEVEFSYAGVDYTIDLSRKNQAALDKALKPFLDAATRVPRGRSRTKPPLSKSRNDLGEIRAWARRQGIEVSDRGRIPKAVISQFEAAH